MFDGLTCGDKFYIKHSKNRQIIKTENQRADSNCLVHGCPVHKTNTTDLDH